MRIRNSRTVVENNYRRKSAQCLRSSGEVVQQQQFGQNSRVSGQLIFQKTPDSRVFVWGKAMRK